jgi:acetoin utilization deacetylase AcuC-like enzyme
LGSKQLSEPPGALALKVFYDPRQHTDANVSYSPSAGKPAKVVESWKRLGIPLAFMPVDPATPDDLALSHSRAYVDGVLSAELQNGFGNRSPEVAATLPWTTGSMVSAAVHAATAGGVTISPTSGFHHAGYERGTGFCTFNGLMVAARILQSRGLARKIGVLDIDMHYGDGTADIIDRLGLTDIHHWTFGAHYSSRFECEGFLRELPRVLEGFRDREVVLYQAGADPFIEDPLGGVLTAEELRLRDRLVFTFFAREKIPLSWNLAGGYARDEAGTIRPVLNIHDATLRECYAAYSADSPSEGPG